jgi:hypothetical protein
MINEKLPTHTHRKVGKVAVLESTESLAKISVVDTGEQFWVKNIDLTPVGVVLAVEPKVARKK